MNTPLRLAAFAVGLAAVFGAALGVGAAVGPVGPAADESFPTDRSPTGDDPAPGTPHEEHQP